MSGGRVRAFLGTEIGRVIPLSRRSPATWVGAMDEAGLPAEADCAIRAVVSRTRLWGGEKLDVARELIAHARDALESGTEPAAVASAMGEPARVARLIRRAVKRKRHWTWHARVWLVRALAIAVGLMAVTAGLLTARLYVGDPRPTRNFIAEMNEPFERYEDDERSWALIKEVNIAIRSAVEPVEDRMQARAQTRFDAGLTERERALGFDQAGVSLVPGIEPAHPDYDEMLALLDGLAPALETAREAASREVIGPFYSTRWPEDIDYTTKPPGWLDDPLPDSDDPAEQDMLIGVLLPWLGPVRLQSHWLAFDARVAAREGDAARVAADLEAMLSYARQVDKDQILISNLVALAVVELARVTLNGVMDGHPGLLDREQLVSLAHGLGSSREMFEALPLTWEINRFEDVLQRAFTDDGEGDGHLTNEGIELLSTMASLSSEPNPIRSATQAVGLVAGSGRAEERRIYMQAMALLRADEEAGYEIFRGRGLESERWAEKTLSDMRYGPASVLMPALGRAVSTQAIGRARIDGTLLAIAAELYRMDTGAWPGGVDELVPGHLPSVPEDPFTGDAMRLGVRADGQLVVYGVGRDGDDDGGRMDPSLESEIRPKADGRDPRRARFYETANAVGWGTGRVDDPFIEAPDGDWVLFPSE